MAVEVVMPRLGWTMETGKIAEWLKNDGDAIRAGDILFTVESDKALQEVEALDSGTLSVVPAFASPGVEAHVGEAVAHLLQPGESDALDRRDAPAPQSRDRDQAREGATSRPARDVAAGVLSDAARDRATSPTHLSDARRPAISPRARRVAAQLSVDWTTLAGSGRTGRIVERDVRARREAQSVNTVDIPARVTPIARRVARTVGVDVDELAAQKPGQRIALADVEAATGVAAPESHSGRGRPIGTIRGIIAERMVQSVRTVAPVTLTTDCDASEFVLLRERVKGALAGSDDRAPSYNDLLARLLALALVKHPSMNSSWSEAGIIEHDTVNIGFAVDTERGLFVPVVRDVQRKSVQQIARESARLVEQTRAGTVAPDDLGGGTFTLTNLGTYDIDAFTPIINLPQAAILGVGRIVARPVVIDQATGEIAARKMMALSLTFDHRLADGAPAARFLQHVKQSVEQPYGWLTT